MNKKTLMSKMVKPINHLTMEDLPAELVEWSEKDLQQVVGGDRSIITISTKPRNPFLSPGPFPPLR